MEAVVRRVIGSACVIAVGMWVCTAAGGCGAEKVPVGDYTHRPADAAEDERLLWRDLDPAVRFAARECGMAVERVDRSAEGERVYELVTVKSEPVVLRARLAPAEAGADGAGEGTNALSALERLELSAEVGRFGDGEREEKLVAETRARLRALRRVEP